MLGVTPESVVLDHVGLNHLTWERAAYVDGVDRLPGLLAEHLQELADEVELPERMLRLGAVPSYYLRYFYCHDRSYGKSGASRPGASGSPRSRPNCWRCTRTPHLDTKPALLGERGGAFYSEAAVGLIAALHGLDPDGVHSVNVRNGGTLPFLPDDAVIEVSARVDEKGPVALPVRPLDPDLAGLISAVSGYEQLAVDTARDGSRDKLYRTLLAHPLVGQHEYAEALTDKLLAANAPHLAWAR